MRYLSTRGGAGDEALRPFSEILLEGLAPDGGLYLPTHYPKVDAATLARWRALSYADLAFEILALYIDDIPAADLRAMVHRTYSAAAFGSDDVTPLKALEPGLWLQGLSNGPTLAFKDIAMQLLGQLFEYELARRGAQLNILGATSGDTGSAAEYAMRGKRGIRVFMLSPQGRMSPFQQAQMFSLPDANIHNIAIEGVFDDCQDIVKAISADAAFKRRYAIGAVNSINWARIAAQVTYYFVAAVALGAPHRPVSFTVPTGNFGDILAGYVAKEMGLPIERLVIATNENDILARTLATGRYELRGVKATQSQSMDIQVSSNFERLLFDAYLRDAGAIRNLMARLYQSKAFDIAAEPLAAIRADFDAAAVSEKQTADEIARVYKASGYILDPHSAVGVAAGFRALEKHAHTPMIVAGTAHPAKFPDAIKAATGVHPALPPHLADIMERKERFDVVKNDIGAVETFIRARARALTAA